MRDWVGVVSNYSIGLFRYDIFSGYYNVASKTESKFVSKTVLQRNSEQTRRNVMGCLKKANIQAKKKIGKG